MAVKSEPIIMTPDHHVLVVGTGSIGERHTRCFLASGRARVSICEINDSLREKVSSSYEVESAHADLASALQAQHDAAIICTPAQLHVPIALQILDSGRSVLIEKPLSTSFDDIDRLRSIERDSDLTIAVGYTLRHHPALIAMRQAILDGRFGAPLQLVGLTGHHFPTYRPAYRDIYFTDHATGGGAVQDGSTHTFNAAEWLVGPMTELCFDTDHIGLEGAESVEDTVHGMARHGNVLASYTTNMYQAPYESAITIVCERGTCRFELHSKRWRWMGEPDSDWVDESFDDLERDTLFVQQAHSFCDTLEGKAQPSCSLEEGIQTLRVNLAALRSAKSRVWETP